MSDGRLRTDVLETAPIVDLVEVVTSALRGTLPPDPEGGWWTYGSPDGRHLTVHVVPAHPGSGHELRTSLLNLRLHEFFWTTSVAVADDRLAHGPIEMVFAPEGRDHRPLTNDEVELVLRAVADLDGSAAIAVTAIAARYPALQQSYEYEGADRTTLMPDVDSPEGLLALIDLARIYVHH